MSNVLIGIIGITLTVVLIVRVLAEVRGRDGQPLSIFAVLVSIALCRFGIRPPAGWAAT